MEVDDVIDAYGFGSVQVRVILAAGLTHVVDSMEMMLLSVLGPVLQCEWRLTSAQSALLTTAVFSGMLIGAPLFGYQADRLGRKTVLIISSACVGFFGLLGAASPNLVWLIFLRACCGFAMGGVLTSSASITSEVLPRSYRAVGLNVMLCFWAGGSLVEGVLAYFTLPLLGWRWLMVLTAVPPIAAVFCLFCIPESPRYLLLNNQEDKAIAVLQTMAPKDKTVNLDLKPGDLKKATLKSSSSQGNALDMFHKEYIVTTLIEFVIWFICGFNYYGLILIISILPSHSHPCLQDASRMSEALSGGDTSCCEHLSGEAYLAMAVAAVGEIVSIPVAWCALETLGRKLSLAIFSLILSGMFIIVDLCMGQVGMNIVFLLGRLLTFTYFNFMYVYTSEVFPTSIRTVAIGCCSAVARVGAMLTPFVAQVHLKEHSTIGALTIYAGAAFVGAVAAILLPIETKGRRLQETIEESKCEKHCD